MAEPTDADVVDRDDTARFGGGGSDSVHELGIDGVEESGQDRSSGPDEQGADEGRDDEPDDRVGPGPAGQAGQPGTYDRQRGEAVGAGMLTVSDERQ